MTRRKSLTRKKRIELFEQHKGLCHICGTKIHAERGEAWEVEHVEALEISGRDDWDNLRPAHVACHKVKTAQDVKIIAKCNRRKAKHLGIKKPSRFPGARNSKFKQKIGGGVVYRDSGEEVR